MTGEINSPVLSICIPTYNRVNKLKKLLESIFNQISPEINNKIQVCISNNHSPDTTELVVNEYILKYPKIIKYHNNEKNQGAIYNIIRVYDMSDGEYLWLIGDDDIFVEDAFKTVLNLIEENNNSLDFIGIKCLHNNNSLYYNSLNNYSLYNNDDLKEFELKDRLSSHSFMGANVFKRAIKSNISEYYWTLNNNIFWPNIHIFLYNFFSYQKILITEPLIIQTGEGLFWYKNNWFNLLFQKFQVVDEIIHKNRLQSDFGKNLATKMLMDPYLFSTMVGAKIESSKTFKQMVKKIASYKTKNNNIGVYLQIWKLFMYVVNYIPRYIFEFMYFLYKLILKKDDFRKILKQKLNDNNGEIREGTSC